jgi:hypothetical protein
MSLKKHKNGLSPVSSGQVELVKYRVDAYLFIALPIRNTIGFISYKHYP